jgi:GNAT superfamily N-acetyltransferase
VNIRLAEARDVGALYALLGQLAAFEGGTVTATEADLLRDGFGARPLFEALLAEADGRAVGMLVFLPLYSSWRAQPALLIHDLFVTEAVRGLGAGTALVRRLGEIAAARGCCRIDVNVLDWNERARAFYQSLGFGWNQGWLGYRLSLS